MEEVCGSLGFGNENSAEPLYPGARVSEAIGTLMVHSLAMKHGFTKAALADVLKVVSLHLPAANVPSSYRSVHCLLRASSSRTHSPIIHTLCSDCGQLVQQGGQDDCLHSHAITFHEISLEKQLQALFKGMYLQNVMMLINPCNLIYI